MRRCPTCGRLVDDPEQAHAAPRRKGERRRRCSHAGPRVPVVETVEERWGDGPAIGGRKWGLVAGCYFEHAEDYAGPDSNDDWWRGLVFLRGVDDGDAAIEAVPMRQIYERYAPDLLPDG